MKEWPEPVERVVRVLREEAVESRVEEFADGTQTAEDAAAAIGCGIGQIVKSLLFLCDGRPVLAMVAGDRRADRARIQHQTGSIRAKVASPDEVLRLTGFEAGGVAPFPLPGIETVLIDQGLLVEKVLWFGAGSPRHVASLAPPDLLRLARARAVDIAADTP